MGTRDKDSRMVYKDIREVGSVHLGKMVLWVMVVVVVVAMILFSGIFLQ